MGRGWLLALVVVVMMVALVALVGCEGRPAGGGGRGSMLGPDWPGAICDAVATCWPAPR